MLKTMDWLFRQTRSTKRLVSILLDITFISIAYWGSFYLRLDSLEVLHSISHWFVFITVVTTTLACFIRTGLYRAVIRFLGHHAITSMLIAIGVSTLTMIVSAHFVHAFLPRSIPIIYSTLILILCGGARLLVRAIYHHNIKRYKTPVIIYGAGSAGRQLNMSLIHGNEYRSVAFIDDNKSLSGSLLQGLTIYSTSDLEWIINKFGVEKILLALSAITNQRRKEIIESLECYSLEILTIPGMADIVNGNSKISDLKEVTIEDLLGREPVAPYPELISTNIFNKVVLVTGAGGSIGSELCRQIILQRPETLILFEISEYALYKIEQELLRCSTHTRIVPLLGSVQSYERVLTTIKTFRVQTIYHAAACKHVPIVEENIVEGVRNNIFGTLNTVNAAIENHVESVVLISTDKAVRPTNVMGATKRIAELILQSLAKEQETTRLSMVRFGNVLGSSGSVVPLFKEQITNGGPVTVTDTEITRYFMTIPEAAQLVIQAGAMARGGDVFVLDMGEPVRILDLAKKMIHLTGFDVISSENPEGDIEIKITGLRPGEKLFEELLISGEEMPTQHPRIKTAHETYLPWLELDKLLTQLKHACDQYDVPEIKRILINSPTLYNPNNNISDLVWNEINSQTLNKNFK